MVVYGGTSRAHQRQELKRGVHVLIATPGPELVQDLPLAENILLLPKWFKLLYLQFINTRLSAFKGVGLWSRCRELKEAAITIKVGIWLHCSIRLEYSFILPHICKSNCNVRFSIIALTMALPRGAYRATNFKTLVGLKMPIAKSWVVR